MTTIFLFVTIIVLCFIVYRFYTNKNEAAKNEVINEVVYDSKRLYDELMLLLEASKKQIGKQNEAIELEKSVLIARNNEEQLMKLMPEVNRLFDHSLTDLGDFYFTKAEQFVKSQNNLDALQYYSKAISFDKNPRYYNNRGCLYHKMENLETAIEDYSKAIMLNTNNGEYYYNRGGAYYAMKRNNEAKRDLERASQLGIKDAEKMLSFYF